MSKNANGISLFFPTNSFKRNPICSQYAPVTQSFISPTNEQTICFKILKFTLKYTINAPTCFGLTKPSSGSLQSVLRWSYNIGQLIYFVIKMFGRVAA
jgi:hypothetical protein